MRSRHRRSNVQMTLGLAGWGFLAVASAPTTSTAQEITFQASATVVFANDVDPRIGPGDTLTARYTFDASTPASQTFPTAAIYAGAMRCARAEVEGVAFGTLDPETPLNAAIQVSDGDADSYQAQLVAAEPGLSSFTLVLSVLGPSDAITSLALPTVPPDAAAFTTRTLLVDPFGSLGGITAQVDTLAVSAAPLPCDPAVVLPEPGGLLGPLGAVLGLGWFARSKGR
jgi:hypothetical protein